MQGSAGASGGIPIPNPDTLQEFKVQTGLYDAASGRFAGGNTSVITKTGSNAFHGTIFEFVRNNILNANAFFLKETGQQWPDLKQNQFGFALGGPVRKDNLLFFGSYQGTRQVNGVAAGPSRAALRQRSLNQALSASPSNPIRGVKTNEPWLTVSCLLHVLEDPGHGRRWGRASFDRTHRFVFSETWEVPGPARGLQHELLGGWELAAVVTIQSGSALTVADTNANHVFGISEDRAELRGKCARNQLVTEGLITSKLNSYFKASCFSTQPVIGVDGIGTAFGNSGTGIVDGPGQANLDIAFSKAIALTRLHEKARIRICAEFFNALNHAQFSNPDSNFSSPTFGTITSAAVNPRIGQLAAHLEF